MQQVYTVTKGTKHFIFNIDIETRLLSINVTLRQKIKLVKSVGEVLRQHV